MNQKFLKFLNSFDSPNTSTLMESIKHGYKAIFENNYKTVEIGGESIDMPITSVSGTFYHGTSFDKDEEPFDSFSIDMSDYPAVWVTDDEEIAKEFASNREGIPVLYTINFNSNKMAQIDYSLFEDLKDYLGFFDLRESIEWLRNLGFEGWVTQGSVGTDLYNDIAIFYEDMIEIKSIKKIK